MLRTDIINLLIKKIDAKKYLEIGISDGVNFSKIKCHYKVGVDPETSATFQMTSDEFFDQNKEKFDVIFVDGLHHADQVYRDITNSLNILNDNGYIICHDMNPLLEEHQTIPYKGGIWNGDCWKAFVFLRKERSDLKMCVVDTDYGCGIIQKGSQELLSVSEELTWENFNKNRSKWLNLISVENFIKEHNNFDEPSLDDLILDYISKPEDPQINYLLGSYYETIGQTASAISYYLRSAERSENDLLKYECLLRGAICFTQQGTRNFTVKGFLLHALTICPKRPEAYYLMSLFHEKEGKDGSWNESYTISSIGLKVSDLNPPPLRSDVGYPGSYGLLFQKAKSGWWCGLCEESRDIFLDLLKNHEMNSDFKQLTIDNLKRLNVNVDELLNQEKEMTIILEEKIDPVRKDFDWGEIQEDEWFLKVVTDEIFVQNIYQKFFEVEKDDLVVDVGASVGPFTYSILDKDPKKVYCFEPHKNLFKTLSSNLEFASDKVTVINKGIADANGEIVFKGLYNKESNAMWSKEDVADAMTFKTFIESYNIKKIDFLKTDCEGGEYDIFTQENFDWIKKNVKKITGEWHLHNDYLKDKFRKFRDLYLKEMPNHQVYSMDGVDIKWSLWDDWFINYYGTITVWVDNRSDETIDSFDWGLFEKNDLLAKCIKKEFDGEANYEKFFSVKENDIVLDIGASVGPFTKSILDKNPKLVLCLEPHPGLFETLNNNFSEFDNVKCINKGISSKDGEVIFENLFDDTKGFDYVGDDLWKKKEQGIGITFRSLIRENNIEKIDFLKIDCEGGEYDVFTLDNFYWIKNNVKKIAGEWHLGDNTLRQKFLDFRDFYLRKFDNFKVFFVDADSNFFDVTDEIWSNDFVTKYGWINIYIDNE